MTSPRRDKDGNMIAPKRLAKAGKKRTTVAPDTTSSRPRKGESEAAYMKRSAKRTKATPPKGLTNAGNKPASVRPTSTSERKAIAADLKKLPTRKKATPKPSARKTKAAGKLKGFEAIAKRKEARAKAAGKTYDIAKSNPRLAKKLKAKGRAVDNADLTNRAAKKINKVQKQADGFEAILRRKAARLRKKVATGPGITAKSNPRLIKKLENKQRAANRISNRNK